MKSGGAKLDKISLRCFGPSYRGIVAQRRIFLGEPVIVVPREEIVTVWMAKQTEIGAKLATREVPLIYPNNSLLSLFVLMEQAKSESKWHTVFEGFPKSVSNFPLFFTEEEKKLLIGSPFLTTVEELRKDMGKDYALICETAPEFARFSLEEFMRIRTLVNSRIFGIRVDGAENDSIVPFAGIVPIRVHRHV